MDEPRVPRYGRRTVAEVLPSVAAAIGVPGKRDALGLTEALDGVNRVAVLLVDGLGHHQLAAHAEHAPVLAGLPDVGDRGDPLTAPFPSTTPVSLVSVGTGLSPAEHGIVGFTVAVPGTGRTLTHIHWPADAVDPAIWQPNPTVFGRLAAAGLTGTVVGPAAFARSALTDAAYRGATYAPAYTAGDLVDVVASALRSAARGIVYAYVSTLDFVGHRRGSGSPAWRAELTLIDRTVGLLVERLPADAALLVTADHGMVDVAPEARIDVDTNPGLLDGVTLLAGEPRARYVHVRPGAGPDVCAAWREVLGTHAWIRGRDEAVAAGWFGPPDTLTPAVAGRIGDVVAAVRDRSALVATRADPLSAALAAYHGSFLPDELDVPLRLARG